MNTEKKEHDLKINVKDNVTVKDSVGTVIYNYYKNNPLILALEIILVSAISVISHSLGGYFGLAISIVLGILVILFVPHFKKSS